jgi:phosphatidylglycerophosphate synthase
MKKIALIRRPIKVRKSRWAVSMARGLAKAGVRPNFISILSLVFALAAGVCLALTPHVGRVAGIILFVSAALLIPLRLLCNLLDGMLAIEEGFRSKTGNLYNELPDRVSDAVILIGAGYSGFTWGPELGWTAALLAVLTAYIRTLGAATGARQHFTGPMAKQQRMFIMIAASLVGAVEAAFNLQPWIMAIALVVIILGSLITAVIRLGLVAKDLNAK